jgi:hypothetical protein
VATDDESVEFDDQYPLRFLECRVQHDWKVVGHYHADGLIVRSSMCARCGCDRWQRWTAGGTRYATRYSHPDGYRVKGGVPTWEVRMAVLKQVTIYDSAEALTKAMKKSIETRKSRDTS